MRALSRLSLTFLSAITLNAASYKAVFDCSSDNMRYVKSRMWLIGKTMEMFKSQGDTLDAVLTIHGGCSAITSKAYDDVVDDEDEQTAKAAQDWLKKLDKKGVRVIVCAMSLEAHDIDPKEVLPFVHISPNSYLDTIKYQNRGYALMPLK